MQKNLHNKHVQISGSASLFYLVKGDQKHRITQKQRRQVFLQYHMKTNIMVFAPHENSDQPGHLPSLYQILRSLAIGRVYRNDFDQTERMPVVDMRKCHVEFLTVWLVCLKGKEFNSLWQYYLKQMLMTYKADQRQISLYIGYAHNSWLAGLSLSYPVTHQEGQIF